MQDFEFVVVGGGIVGLSVAWAILEKNPSLALRSSKRNPAGLSHQTGQKQRRHPFRHLLQAGQSQGKIVPRGQSQDG